MSLKAIRLGLVVISALLLSSCSKIGYGVLLWSVEEPSIASGTILPVYIRSNIEKVYVIGVPHSSEKIEIPLTQLEFFSSRLRANRSARAFKQYALVYAENMQDGLPVRDSPDNGARRVYRLRMGELIKILEKVEGRPPISTTGDPLPGDWYLVLTNDGVKGYCFSYRLNLFEHYEGELIAAPVRQGDLEPGTDHDLELVLTGTWSPELYNQMIESRQMILEDLERKFGFDPGRNTRVATITMPDFDRTYRYQNIVPDGERSWRFEGTNLQMNLRTDGSLAVHFFDVAGTRRTISFVTLPTDVNELITQETERRQARFMSIYNQGPIYTSDNYGTIILTEEGNFTWTNFDSLVPHIIPDDSLGTGEVYMGLFMDASFQGRFTGAMSLRLTDVDPNRNIFFFYILNNQGLQLEVIPDLNIENYTATRRASTPVTLYFIGGKEMPTSVDTGSDETASIDKGSTEESSEESSTEKSAEE